MNLIVQLLFNLNFSHRQNQFPLYNIPSHTILKMLSSDVHPIRFLIQWLSFSCCPLKLLFGHFQLLFFFWIILANYTRDKFTKWTLMTWLRELENPKLIKKMNQRREDKADRSSTFNMAENYACFMYCNLYNVNLHNLGRLDLKRPLKGQSDLKSSNLWLYGEKMKSN